MTEKILELIGKLTKNPIEVASLKDGDNLDETAVLSAIKTSLSTHYSNVSTTQRNRGLKEGRKPAEEFLKAKGFENPDDLKGADFLNAGFEHVISAKIEEATKGTKIDDFSPEQLRALPNVATLLSKEVEAYNKKATDIQDQFDKFKQGVQRDKDIAIINKLAEKSLDKQNFVLSTGDVKREDRLQSVFDRINYNDIKLSKNGDKNIATIVDDEGYPIQNDLGHAITFDEYIAKRAPFQKDVTKPEDKKVGKIDGFDLNLEKDEQLMKFENKAAYEAYIMGPEGADPKKMQLAHKSWMAQNQSSSE